MRPGQAVHGLDVLILPDQLTDWFEGKGREHAPGADHARNGGVRFERIARDRSRLQFARIGTVVLVRRRADRRRRQCTDNERADDADRRRKQLHADGSASNVEQWNTKLGNAAGDEGQGDCCNQPEDALSSLSAAAALCRQVQRDIDAAFDRRRFRPHEGPHLAGHILPVDEDPAMLPELGRHVGHARRHLGNGHASMPIFDPRAAERERLAPDSLNQARRR